ncbi:amidase family protein [Mesorhizobium sp.]|uniref:amidase family protein n=1 Tax=Mesorhizobium sp. TaxID=1871066 RepID=UPI0025F61954|nr:amidase family protein [Mesorhizobium sp.]
MRANADPALPDLVSVDGPKIFPQPPGTLPDRYEGGFDLREYVERARSGVTPVTEIPTIEEGLKGLEATRRIDFEDWLDAHGIDAVVLPAAADVGPADADIDEASAALAWRNGTWVANGNLVWRHFGIPTVTVPMGTMADIGMPVGLTFAGKAYDDERLLRMAGDFERSTQRRTRPPRTPELDDDVFSGRPARAGDSKVPAFAITLAAETRPPAIRTRSSSRSNCPARPPKRPTSRCMSTERSSCCSEAVRASAGMPSFRPPSISASTASGVAPTVRS